MRFKLVCLVLAVAAVEATWKAGEDAQIRGGHHGGDHYGMGTSGGMMAGEGMSGPMSGSMMSGGPMMPGAPMTGQSMFSEPNMMGGSASATASSPVNVPSMMPGNVGSVEPTPAVFPGPPPFPPHPPPPPPPPDSPMAACRPDFFRFCAFRVEDMRNPEQILQCMESHSAELAPLCREFVQNVTNDLNAFHAGCDSDMAALCPDTKMFTPERKQCVVRNLAALSKPCLSAISTVLVHMESCHRHFGPGGPPGGPPGGFPPSGPFDPAFPDPANPWGPPPPPAPGGNPWGPPPPYGPPGGGPGGGHFGPGGPEMRGFRLCALFGAGVAGGLTVVVVAALLRCVAFHACRGRGRFGCRRACGGAWPPPPGEYPPPPPPMVAVPPGWAGFHVAQPVPTGEAAAAAAAGYLPPAYVAMPPQANAAAAASSAGARRGGYSPF